MQDERWHYNNLYSFFFFFFLIQNRDKLLKPSRKNYLNKEENKFNQTKLLIQTKLII